MFASRYKLGAAMAALLITSQCLTACEKSAGGGDAAPASADSSNNGGASTVPGLPFLAKPVFAPDLVDMVGGIDLYAIAADKAALAQSSAPAVKSFAATSLDAHTKSMTALNSAIEASGQTISMPDTAPGDLQTKLAALQKLSGPAFDKAYLGDQIAIQRAEAAALPFYAKHGDSAPLQAFANRTAPTAQTLLTAAQAAQSTLK